MRMERGQHRRMSDRKVGGGGSKKRKPACDFVESDGARMTHCTAERSVDWEWMGADASDPVCVRMCVHVSVYVHSKRRLGQCMCVVCVSVSVCVCVCAQRALAW